MVFFVRNARTLSLRKILRTEKFNAVADIIRSVIHRNARCQPVRIFTGVVLFQCIQIAAVAEFDVPCGRHGVGSHAEVGELAGIGIIALKLIQPTQTLEILISVCPNFVYSI